MGAAAVVAIAATVGISSQSSRPREGFVTGTRTEQKTIHSNTASHIERETYVYVRQSSTQQVRTRLEEQRRQYDLRERAQASASSVWLSSMKIWAAPELAP